MGHPQQVNGNAQSNLWSQSHTMSIGSLSAQVILDDPSRVHYGPHDPVKGVVELSYRPTAATSPELFGRLVLDVTFHGRTKSKIWRSTGQSTTVYRTRIPLFSTSETIYNDVFKTTSGQVQRIPFKLFFPSSCQYSMSDQDWKDNIRYISPREGLPLPPSMNRTRVFMRAFECFIEYRIGCTMRMDGLPVEMVPPGRDGEAFAHYDSPRSSREPAPPRILSGSVQVSNKELMEESSRPSGLKEKMKATFSSDFYPTYTFDWKIQAPSEIYNGSFTTMVVRIDPRDPTTKREDLVIPPVYLEQCTLEIKSITYARTEKKLWVEQHEHGTSTEKTLNGWSDPKVPFSGDEDWTKVITFEAVLIPSSLRFINIRVDHTIKFRGVFRVAGKTETISDSWNISVYPPLEDPPPPIDGPPTSSGPVVLSNGVGSSKQGLSGFGAPPPDLPRQEQEQAPPMYDEAANDPPPRTRVPPREKGGASGKS